MLGIILSFYLSITIILCFIRLRIGVAMFLLYSIIVPIVQFFSFGQNLFSLIIIFALIINYGYRTLIYKPLLPFIFLYISQFLLIPFHLDVPIDVQLNLYRIDLMSTLLLPFVMINVMNQDADALPLFRKVILISLIVALLYSLFLLAIPGINPYILLINSSFNGSMMDASYFSDYYAAEGQGRLFGRISGVFVHPMTNGLFLSLSIIYIFSFLFDLRNAMQKRVVIMLILTIICTIFFIGVRTAIGATAVSVAIYMLLERKFNLIAYSILMCGIVFFIIMQINGMQDFVLSIFDSDSSNVAGSSMTMRMSQFNGALTEIASNPLFGKGYGWTAFYTTTKGSHPVLLAFESLIYIVLCNNGLVGIAIWIILIFLIYKGITQEFRSNYSHVMITLVIAYLLYSIITGEYGYMKYLLIFYSLMWMYGKEKHSKNKIIYKL